MLIPGTYTAAPVVSSWVHKGRMIRPRLKEEPLPIQLQLLFRLSSRQHIETAMCDHLTRHRHRRRPLLLSDTGPAQRDCDKSASVYITSSVARHPKGQERRGMCTSPFQQASFDTRTRGNCIAPLEPRTTPTANERLDRRCNLIFELLGSGCGGTCIRK